LGITQRRTHHAFEFFSKTLALHSDTSPADELLTSS
jgi:hypothetical protein